MKFWIPVSVVGLIAVTIGLVSSQKGPELPEGYLGYSVSGPHSYSKQVSLGSKLALNTVAPDFSFTDTNGKSHKLSEWRGQVPLFVFVDSECPCVTAYDKRMKALRDRYSAQGVQLAYVFSSPIDSMSRTRQTAEQRGYNWTVVRDGDQTLLKKFNAQCTIEAFLFDREGVLRYHGGIDDNIYFPAKVKETHLTDAIDAVLAGVAVPKAETKVFACSIPRLDKQKKTRKS